MISKNTDYHIRSGFIITSLSLALLAYEHLTIGFVDYGLLSLCVIYLFAFLLALALSGSL